MNTDKTFALIEELLEQHHLDQVKLNYYRAIADSEAMKARIAKRKLAEIKGNWLALRRPPYKSMVPTAI